MIIEINLEIYYLNLASNTDLKLKWQEDKKFLTLGMENHPNYKFL